MIKIDAEDFNNTDLFGVFFTGIKDNKHLLYDFPEDIVINGDLPEKVELTVAGNVTLCGSMESQSMIVISSKNTTGTIAQLPEKQEKSYDAVITGDVGHECVVKNMTKIGTIAILGDVDQATLSTIGGDILVQRAHNSRIVSAENASIFIEGITGHTFVSTMRALENSIGAVQQKEPYIMCVSVENRNFIIPPATEISAEAFQAIAQNMLRAEGMSYSNS